MTICLLLLKLNNILLKWNGNYLTREKKLKVNVNYIVQKINNTRKKGKWFLEIFLGIFDD